MEFQRNVVAAKEINYDEQECRWNISGSQADGNGGQQSEEREWQHSSFNEEMLTG